MALSVENVGNNHDQNLNLSLSLSSNPSGSRGEGMDGVISSNNRFLPFKRRYSDLASGESLIGESSTRSAQLERTPELAAPSPANSNNNVMTISSFRNELANVHRSRDFEAAIGHNRRIVSNMQNQNQVATAPHAIIRANRLLNNNSGGQQVTIPNQAHLFHQSGHSRFNTSSGTADGATSSVQPLGYAPNFSEPQWASPPNNIMSSRNNSPPVVLAFHSETRSEVIEPLHDQRIMQGNLMHHPQYRRETTHFLNHEQHGSSCRNSRTPNENSLVARYETQARGIVRPSITSMLLDNNRLLEEVRDTVVLIIREVAQRTILRAEEDIQIFRTMHNLPPHGQFAAIEQNQDTNMGLAEEEILKHIKRENFELVGEQTPENKEVCSICQEDYVNGEEVGRLDCVHIFHINCIKEWLVIKNLCPICKQTALATDGDDDI